MSKSPVQLACLPSVDEPSARWDLVLQFVAIAWRRLVPGRTVWEPDAALPRWGQMPRWHFELGHVVVIDGRDRHTTSSADGYQRD